MAWLSRVGLLISLAMLAVSISGCGQGSGRAGDVSPVRSRASNQLDAIILTRVWLRAFYPAAFPHEDPQEITPAVIDNQMRYHWQVLYKSGLVQDVTVWPDDSFEAISTFPDKSWQKLHGGVTKDEGNSQTTPYTVDYSDGVHLAFSFRRDINAQGDPLATYDGSFDFPDGSHVPFRLERVNFADHLRVVLQDGRHFEMAVMVDFFELFDPTQPVTGKLESDGQVQIDFTLKTDPQTPFGWIWELHDPTDPDRSEGRFRLNEQFSGFGEWSSGDQVESTVSWQMPPLIGGSSDLPKGVEARVTPADTGSYVAGPSSAALALLNRDWDSLASSSYPG